MWIETTDRKIINAENLEVIEIGSDNKSIVGKGKNETYLISDNRSTKEAKDALEEIKKAIEKGKKIIEINKIKS